MRALARHFLSRQFAMFLIVGGVCAAANFGAGVFVRNAFPDWPVGIGVDVGMIVGTILSFFLNRWLTFAATSEPMGLQAARFALMAVGATILGFALAEAAFAAWRCAGSPWGTRAQMENAVHVFVLGVSTIYNFLAMKFFALRERRPT